MTHEHPEINTRPQLPDIFPQSDVTVEGEEHVFEVSETTNGTEAQLEYTLDKAPVGQIESIQGTDQSGDSRTFSNGVDYDIAAKTDVVTDSFTFADERHSYQLVYEIDAGTESVVDNSGDTYTNGTDYEIISDSEEHQGDLLNWLDGGDTPDDTESFSVSYEVTFQNALIRWNTDGEHLPEANSQFFVTYTAESVISRYLDSHEYEFDDVKDTIEQSINNKFVDHASGDSLDELGKLFGPTIGKRRGRSDEQYRIYLKSVVQSFISRGTVNGIKLAVSAASGVPIDDITINEDFEENSYQIEVIPDNPVDTPLIGEVAEISDPSGVGFDGFRITPLKANPDEMQAADDISITEGNLFEDEISVDDATGIFNRAEFEDTTVDDSVLIDPNKIFVTDDAKSSDTAQVNPNLTTATEDAAVDDAVSVLIQSVGDLFWEPSDTGDNNWNVFNWVSLEDLTRTLAEDVELDDSGDLRPKAATLAESVEIDDDGTEQPKAAIVSEGSGAADAVTIKFNATQTSDVTGSDDIVTVTEQSVAWDTANWNQFDWVQAQ